MNQYENRITKFLWFSTFEIFSCMDQKAYGAVMMRALSGDFQRSSCVDKIRIRDMIQLCQLLYCGVVSFGDCGQGVSGLNGIEKIL